MKAMRIVRNAVVTSKSVRLLALIGWVTIIQAGCTGKTEPQGRSSTMIQSAGDDFPLPERFIQVDDVAGYEQAAQTYLETHADSDFAPRVALDLLMISRIKNQEEIAEAMETKLLLDYPQTVHGTYFRTSYAKGEDYRSRLSTLLEQYVKTPSADFPKKYLAAVDFGVMKFGNELFNDHDFLLRSAFVAGAAGDTERQNMLLTAFNAMAKKDDDNKLQPIAALATDETEPLSRRIMGLHEASENPTAGFLRDVLLLRLPAEEKDTPELRPVVAEALLDRKQFQLALPILERLPADQDGDKRLFQRLWSHAMTGDPKRAAELLAQLDQDFPASSWRELGHRVLPAAEAAEKNLDLYVDTFRTIVNTAKQDFSEFEARLSFQDEESSRKLTAYLAYSNSLKLFEIQLGSGKDLATAYRSTAMGSMLYVKGEPAVRRCLQPGWIFSPNIDVHHVPGENFSLHANFGFTQFGKTFSNDSLESPYLNEPEKIRTLLKRPITRLALLGEVRKTEEGRIFSLFRPKVLKPETTEYRMVISHDNRILSVHGGPLDIYDVRYGPAKSLKFSPPPWPKRPMITVEEFDPSLIFETIGKILAAIVAKQGT
jgi:hypothetical protein